MRHSTRSTATTGPAGGSRRYWGYFSLRSSSAPRASSPPSRIAGRPPQARPPEARPVLLVVVHEDRGPGALAEVAQAPEVPRALRLLVDRAVEALLRDREADRARGARGRPPRWSPAARPAPRRPAAGSPPPPCRAVCPTPPASVPGRGATYDAAHELDLGGSAPMRLGYFLPQMGPAAGPDAHHRRCATRRGDRLGLPVGHRAPPLAGRAPEPLPVAGRRAPGRLQDGGRPALGADLRGRPDQPDRPRHQRPQHPLVQRHPARPAVDGDRRAVQGPPPGGLRHGVVAGRVRGRRRAVEGARPARGREPGGPQGRSGAPTRSRSRAEHFRIAPSVIGPKPVQTPHPPIYMAAYTPAAMARVARFADGWMPVGVPLEGIAGHARPDQVDGEGRRPRPRGARAHRPRQPGDHRQADRRRAVHLHRHAGADRRGHRRGARRSGPSEMLLDITFSPDAKTADDFLARADDLWRVAQAS